jgi:hypothetical protein
MKSNYRDESGKPISLNQLCRIAPEWATNMITTLRERQRKSRVVFDKIRDILSETVGCKGGCEICHTKIIEVFVALRTLEK